MMMHRRDLLEMLYNSLTDADKARVLTRKGVVDVETREDDVTVICGHGHRCLLGDLISEGKVLSFLPEKHLLHGKVPWKHYPDGAVEPTRNKEHSWMSEVNWGPLAILAFIVILFLLVASLGRSGFALPHGQNRLVMGLVHLEKGNSIAHCENLVSILQNCHLLWETG